MAPEQHTLDIVVLIYIFAFLEYGIHPARYRSARFFHHCLRDVLAFHPFVINAPHCAPVFPRAGCQTVVTRQRIRIRTDVRRALHVIVTAENICTAARNADIPQRQLDDARSAHHRVADRVLRLPHTPDQCRRAVFRHRFGSLVHFSFRHAAGFFHLFRRPGHDFSLDLLHAVDAIIDVLLVFPAVFENVIQQAIQEWNIST